MTRKFVSHLGFLLFVNLLVKPFWIFGIDRVVQNQVGAAEYGNYFSLYNFSVLLYVLLDFGISNFNNREVSSNEGSLMENLGTLFLLKMFLSFFYLALTLLAAYLVGFEGQQLYWLLILCMGQVFLSFLLFFRSGMAGLQAFREDAWLSVSDRVLMILLVGSLLISLSDAFEIQYFIYLQTLSWGLTAIFAFAWLLRKAGEVSWNWESKSILPLLSATAPFAFVGLLMSIYSRIDGVMIERMLGDQGAEEAGIYAASFRLLDAVNMFAYLFASLLLPMFSRMLSKGESIVALLGLGARLLGGAALLLCLGSYFYGKELMFLLYPAADLYYSEVFVLLISSFFGTAMVYVFGTLLLAGKKLKLLNSIALTGAFLNILLNYLLIPEYGAYGAAAATLMTQVLVGAAQIISVWINFSIPFRLNYLVQIFTFTTALVLLAMLLQTFDMHWIISLLIWLAASLPLAFFTTFFPGIGKLKLLWSERNKY
ncbi:MAG: oligosaccharide flippase family protein [Chitinophagales bacterium]